MSVINMGSTQHKKVNTSEQESLMKHDEGSFSCALSRNSSAVVSDIVKRGGNSGVISFEFFSLIQLV